MSKYSTSTIDGFYEIESLKKILLKLSALNIILCDEDWLRYHRFTKNWSDSIDLAEIDNGSGDNMFVFFTNEGCVIKGFDHESEVSPHAQEEYKVWDGMYDGLPLFFEQLLNDESIEKDDVTFCLWREFKDDKWMRGNVIFNHNENDGSGFLLGTIKNDAEKFKDWADDYFELDLSLSMLISIFNDVPITDEMIMTLNSECDLPSVKSDLEGLVIT